MQRMDVPRLARRRLVDDRDGTGMEHPESPVPWLRGEQWGQIIDENDDDDA